ncbi:MAG: aldo/keto reductase, partial [Planctomycetota bacterium]
MINRRSLLAALGIGSFTGTGWLRWTQAAAAAEGEIDALGRVLPTRAFGRADERVTLACFGGWHLSRFYDDAGAERIVRAAIDAGIRFFDTAESYGPHESERMYGRHLTPRFRDHVFLMSKTMARDAATARQHLDDSLARLRTDRLDLWQMHAIDTPGDVDARIDAGVLDVLLEAKAAGRV